MDLFIERTALCIGVALAILNFNDRQQFLNKLFNELRKTFGINAQNYGIHKDIKRIFKAEMQCNPKAKSRRKKLRAMKKDFCYQNETLEGVTYKSGEVFNYFFFLIGFFSKSKVQLNLRKISIFLTLS